MSASVRTGHRGGMTSWNVGAPAGPNVQGSQQPWAQEIWS